jgi:hypothetical protein
MSKQPGEVLYESEATLRLVDSAIQDMGDLEAAPEQGLEDRLRTALNRGSGAPIGLVGLSDLLARGYSEILAVLDSLRQSRNLLERATVEKIQHTHDKLLEVSNATEVAATDILDGLERATNMVDDLDGVAAESGAPDERGAGIRAALRDELFALMGHMQFQDITSQQLSYASAVLSEMEARLDQIAKVFDPSGLGAAATLVPAAPSQEPVTFDPEASTQNRAERQAVADAIVATKLSNT